MRLLIGSRDGSRWRRLEVGDLPLAGHQGDGARYWHGATSAFMTGSPREAIGEAHFLELGVGKAVGPEEVVNRSDEDETRAANLAMAGSLKSAGERWHRLSRSRGPST